MNDRIDTSINEAMGLLGRLLAAAEDGERTGSLIEILVLKALAHEAQGDLTPALVSLERALTLAKPEGYLRIFVDEGMPMAQLLSEVATKGILPNYVSKLMAVIEAEKQKNDLSPSQQLVDPLSEREIEILNLIAAGLKNKEIAEQLIISLNTVLYHIKNIYRKLGVNKRTLAIAKAKEIKII
jgi:LuxR family maltose regulon positive regulatory protein